MSDDVNTANGWTPTAANINVLPEPLRSYIHQLQTRYDPSGDTQELVLARDTCRQQHLLIEEYERRIACEQVEHEKEPV